MPEQSQFDVFMNQFLPMLLRQQFEEKRVKRYLDKSMKEYAEWGRVREEGKEADMIRNILLQLVESAQAGTEGMDKQLLAVLMQLGEAGVTHPSLPTVTPEAYGQAVSPYGEMGATLMGRLEEKEYLTPEEIANATRIYGTESVNKWTKELEKKKIEEEKLVVQRGGQQIQRDKLALEKKKFGLKREEFDIEGVTTKASKRDKALLDALSKKEGILVDQLKEQEDPESLEIDETKAKGLRSQIATVRKQKMSLLKKMIKSSLDIGKLNRILAKLKKNNVTLEGMEAYKEQFMEAEKLTEIDYEYLKSMLGK